MTGRCLFSRTVLLAFAVAALSLLPIAAAELRTYSFTVRKVPGNPDGYPRPVIGVYDDALGNAWVGTRPFPGPLIYARKGDLLRVTLNNGFDEEQAAVHFHGVHMRDNAWMDGVVGITECGIPARGSFTYEFNVTQTGTFWYHSHAGTQYGDGMVGPMRFDPPLGETDPLLTRYRYGADYSLMLQDWYHESGDDIFTHYRGPHGAYPGYVPHYPWPTTSVLINGRGQYDCHTDNCEWLHPDELIAQCARTIPQCTRLRDPYLAGCNNHTFTPERFVCDGPSLRLRVVNAGTNLPMRFWVDSHTVTIVARDGVETAPLETRFITLPVSQRVDIIVPCNQQSAIYRMYVSTATGFLPPAANTPDVWGYAELGYPGATNPAAPVVGLPGTPYNDPVFNDDVLFEFKMAPPTPRISLPAARRYVLGFNVTYESPPGVPDPVETWLVNGATFMPPTEPMLQTSFRGLPLDSTYRSGPMGRTQVLDINYGETVEIVMYNTDFQQHPWHMHGYTFDIVQAGIYDRASLYRGNDTCGRPFYDLDAIDPLAPIAPYDTAVPVLVRGDSFTVPGGGYVVLRFTADNAGAWFFHCHVDWHMKLGMAVVVSVARDGSYVGLMRPPPVDFPRCGSFNRWGEMPAVLPPPAPAPATPRPPTVAPITPPLADASSGMASFSTGVTVGIIAAFGLMGAVAICAGAVVYVRRGRSSAGYAVQLGQESAEDHN